MSIEFLLALTYGLVNADVDSGERERPLHGVCALCRRSAPEPSAGDICLECLHAE
jgi:hypothetical protein